MRRASAEILAGRERELEAERTRSWGEMARRVAHEMRNPLTPMRLATHRLAQVAMADADAREAVEVLEEETGRLDEMAKQFALLGRPAPVRPSEVDVTELVAGLLSTDVPPDITATLDADGATMVEADHEALVRVFRNLLRNAVESVGSTGGSVDVRVAPYEGGVEVVVSDTGRGLPDGVAERIFEPDFTLKPGGTGLGLAVVRQVVASHGGRVLARDRAGGGAEFVVRLPQSPRVTMEGGAE
jgi:signal transduction histidine kinase